MCAPGAAPRHARVRFRGPDVILEDSGSGQGTYLGGELVQEAVLRDGDVVTLGEGGPRLRFRGEGEPRVSRLQSLPDPHWAGLPGTPGHSGPRAHGLHTSRAFRVTLAVLLLAGAGLLGFSQWWAWTQVAALREAVRSGETERRALAERVRVERERDDQNRRAWEQQIASARQHEQALNSRLQEAASSEVAALRAELKANRETLATLEAERIAAERVIREYGAGVCLIQGSYAFYDGSDRPLRYVLDENGRSGRQDDGSLSLAADAKGDIHTVDYFGTGFLVDASGLVLTNRHVAEPWWNDDVAEALAAKGVHARFARFRAFFPRERQPLDLKLERTSADYDLALLRVALGKRSIPVLPLDRDGGGAVAGQPVVVVGYPTGIEAILAKTDGSVVRQILETHGTSPDRVAEVLAQRALIRPSSTQGHIGDITKTDLVFDAPTTQGGSGGPVFNKAGLVVAVEYAVLPKFGGNAFGVPIRYAIPLIKGRKRP